MDTKNQVKENAIAIIIAIAVIILLVFLNI